MTQHLLSDLRIVEGSAFVAAPLGGLTLAQLGADVIRFDQIGGGIDFRRWPLTPDGDSLFWAGMNKGKRSIQLDLTAPEGRDLARALITAPGPGAGIFLTNFPARGWLDYDSLRAERPDLVMAALSGNRDGSSEVDYTVNPATGFPWATGPRENAAPLNSVLPAWDVALGTLAATGILAAERERTRTGAGQLVRLALSDVAFAMVGNLGRIAQAQIGGLDQDKDGNYLYGAYGHDFETRDGRRVMVVALTTRQWRALVTATDSRSALANLETAIGYSLDSESGRYEARELITALLRPWFQHRTLGEVRALLDDSAVSWGPYQTFRQLVDEDPRCSEASPMFDTLDHPYGGAYLTPASPLEFSHSNLPGPLPEPRLGEHTDQVLHEVLGLSTREVGRLRDAGTVAGP